MNVVGGDTALVGVDYEVTDVEAVTARVRVTDAAGVRDALPVIE